LLPAFLRPGEGIVEPLVRDGLINFRPRERWGTDVLAVTLSDLPSNTFAFLNRVAFGCFPSPFAAG
jgi:hypothetical protein